MTELACDLASHSVYTVSVKRFDVLTFPRQHLLSALVLAELKN